MILAVVVHPAHIQDRDGAKQVLTLLQGRFPRLQRIWADGNYALDFGHSEINPLQTRQEQAGAVWKLDQVWWEGEHHEITLPPMPLPSSPQLAAICLLPGWGENGQSRVGSRSDQNT